MSLFVKANGQNSFYCRIFKPSLGRNVFWYGDFNTGATSSSQNAWTVVSTTSIPYANGRRRFIVTFNVSGTGDGIIDVSGTNV
jgi:hypothetical protein